jgi:rhomboid protease GluP
LPVPYRWQRRLERWKNSFSGFFGVGRQEPRPKLCPACGSLVGINASKCHECGTSLHFSIAALSKILSEMIGVETSVSSLLLVANILMFGVSYMFMMKEGKSGGLNILSGMSGDGSYRLGASHPYPFFYDHQWWRLVTAMFLHGGLLHLGMNMASLLQLGPALEELYGSARYLFLYVFTGAFGYLVSVYTGHFSVGASGALFGLVGAMLAITTKRGGSFMRSLRNQLISSVVIMLVLGFSGVFRIDNFAHIGGLAAGFALGKLFADREPMNSKERNRAYFLGWIAGFAVAASFVLMMMHFNTPPPWSR